MKRDTEIRRNPTIFILKNLHPPTPLKGGIFRIKSPFEGGSSEGGSRGMSEMPTS
jgi:hypothetical protein